MKSFSLRLWVGIVLFAITIVMVGVLLEGSSELRTGQSPDGGINLQRTDRATVVNNILIAWDERGLLDRAILHIKLDSFVFVPAYMALLIYGAWCLRGELIKLKCRKTAFVGVLVIAAVIVASILDSIENYCMLQEISYFPNPVHESDSLPRLVYWCSTAKILLLFSSLFGVAVMDVQRITCKARPSTPLATHSDPQSWVQHK